MMASDLNQWISALIQWIFEVKQLVVFTGAGISNESSLSDSWGLDGIWTRQAKVALESGVRLVIINKGETPLDLLAKLRFWEETGKVLPPLVHRLRELIKTYR